eukprot:COSAG01_NODE_1871_length_9009_cov_5.036139_10_plen_246_part_00
MAGAAGGAALAPAGGARGEAARPGLLLLRRHHRGRGARGPAHLHHPAAPPVRHPPRAAPPRLTNAPPPPCPGLPCLLCPALPPQACMRARACMGHDAPGCRRLLATWISSPWMIDRVRATRCRRRRARRRRRPPRAGRCTALTAPWGRALPRRGCWRSAGRRSSSRRTGPSGTDGGSQPPTSSGGAPPPHDQQPPPPRRRSIATPRTSRRAWGSGRPPPRVGARSRSRSRSGPCRRIGAQRGVRP